MKKLLLLIVSAGAALAAGSVSQSCQSAAGVYQLSFNWTGDAVTGAVPITPAQLSLCTGSGLLQGYRIISAEIEPGSITPTNNYNVFLPDEANVDLLSGNGQSQSSMVAASVAGSPSAAPLIGTFSLSITGQSAAGAKGTVAVYLAPFTQVIGLSPTAPSFAAQGQNLFLASPNGSSGSPGFRAIASADLPALIAANTTGNAATATTATSATSATTAGALTSTPTQCAGGQLATGIAANGNANCTPAAATTSYAVSSYIFAAQAPGGTLSGGTPATVTLTPCPSGVAGTDTAHYLYVSAGSGTAESVLITGGSCTSGAGSGTITFTPANNHSGAWTIQSATGGLQETLNVAGANALIEGAGLQETFYQGATIQASHVTLHCGGCKWTTAGASGGLPNGGAAITLASGLTDIRIDGWWLDNSDTSGSNSYSGIAIGTNDSDVTIRNSQFTGQRVDAVQSNVTGVSGLLVEGNYFNAVLYGVLLNSTGTNINNVRVANNWFSGIYADAIELNIYASMAYTTARNFTITGNNIDVSNGTAAAMAGVAGFGIGVAGPAKGTISGNTLHNCAYQCIHVEGGLVQAQGPLDWIIANNQVDTVPGNVTGLDHGIYLLNCTYCLVSNNTVSGAHNDGIHLDFDGVEQAADVAIVGNVTRSNTGSGINVTGNFSLADQRLNIAHNISVANTAAGLVIGGNAQNDLTVTDNTLQGNGTYGAVFGASYSGLTWKDNDTYNNSSGDVNFVTNNSPTPFQGAKAVLLGQTFTTNSTYTTVFSLGHGGGGWLTVRAWNENSPSTNNLTAVYFVTWNGTTLNFCSATFSCSSTVTAIETTNSGNGNGASLQMSGNNLQVRVSDASGSSVTYGIDVQLTGVAERP